MPYEEMKDEQLPVAYRPDFDKLNKTTSEAPYMEAAFYLLREATHWQAILAGLKPPSSLTRNDAILRGLVVRVCKLLRLTLRELNSKETFQQLSVNRDAIETLATLVYLVGDDGSGARFDQYVMNSLIAERELLQDVQKNVKARNGEEWPIEERMKRSIAATAKAAGIDDVSKLPGRAKIGYPTAEERIKLLGPNVYLGYRMGSVETHGDWNDLYRNHLIFEDGEFSPNLSSYEVRPQVPLGLARLTMMVMLENLDHVVLDEEIARYFRPFLEDLVRRAGEVDELHEHLLAS
ncbi:MULTISPECIES: DUF5677 domain-containing protein [unclassified Streptomyces]|uniref:DUF5677 domain-containing protein n=1 Tax=unclassified Streptomyces TaxID=2593676 RepID=UPI00081D36B9|nr:MULTISPECIES: DUF5677 domain-containing protein [unclassified Streptomyces]MYZ34980.1 hypothetical protein [Streptomyces sp. SID4917]SCF71897.1 hypothetical protein GA0115259_1015012 [Streptomyces sp. MnatMP-M17]